MFRVFMKELDKIKPVKTECVLYSHENRFAGRADVIGSYEKQLCLIDFKFTRTPQNKSESECELPFLQTAAYACAYQEMTGSKIQDLVIIFGFIPNDNETKPRVQIVKLSLMKKFNYEILIEKFLKEKSKYELVIRIQKKNLDLVTSLDKYKAVTNDEIDNPEKLEFTKERNAALFGKIKTIKCKLNSIIKDEDENLALRKKAYINDLVLLWTRITFDAWNFANLFVLVCLEKNYYDMPEINESFFENCIRYVTITKREKDIPLHRGFKETQKLFFSQIGDTYKKDKSNMKSLMQQIALQMTIVAKKHLRSNFFNRLKKYRMLEYLLECGFEDKDYTHQELYKATVNTIILENRKFMTEFFAVAAENKKKTSVSEEINENCVDMLLHENEEKNKKKALPYGLQQKALDDSAKLNVRSKSYHIFEKYWQMLKLIEAFEKEGNVTKKSAKYTRVFSLLPHKSNFTISNIPLTNTNILGCNDLKKEYQCKDLVGFFNFDKFEKKLNAKYMHTNDFKDKKYNFKSLTTDGYSCSLMYETKLKNKNEEKFENKSAKFTKNPILKISKIFKNTKNNKASKNNNHIKKNYIKNKIGKLAVDPGGNKITGITDVKTPNGELQVLKYTTDQYYHDSKINEKNYLMKNYYSQWLNKPQNEHVKQLSFKVSSTEALMKYVNVYASYDKIEHNKEVEEDLNYHEKTTNNMRIIDKIFYFYMNIATDRGWSFKKYIAKQQFYEKIFNKLKFYQIGFGDWSITSTPNARFKRAPAQGILTFLKKKVAILNQFVKTDRV